MQVKKHYDNHLANFYSWMIGDIQSKSVEFQNLLQANGIKPKYNKSAIDLGAGNGIQSIALKDLGYLVTAVDFNQQLLNELKSNPNAVGIKTELRDMTSVLELEDLKPELIVCCGDTILHLRSREQIEKLIKDAVHILENNGYMVLSFRDYSKELNDEQRFIPVKYSDNRILTCILEYGAEKIKVTDLLYEKLNGIWIQKVSSYEKVRIEPNLILKFLEENGMKIELNEPINGMQTIIARKYMPK